MLTAIAAPKRTEPIPVLDQNAISLLDSKTPALDCFRNRYFRLWDVSPTGLPAALAYRPANSGRQSSFAGEADPMS